MGFHLVLILMTLNDPYWQHHVISCLAVYIVILYLLYISL